jgi:hypothetical protein
MFDQAAATAREGANRYPEDRDFPAMLGELLLDAGRNAEAARILQSEGEKRPYSSRLQLYLGAAYLRLGDTASGVKALLRAEILEPGPNIRNAAARELADAGVEMARARDWAERAIAQIHAESASLVFAQAGPTPLDVAPRMAYYFETMGRVLLAQGEHDRAWPFCLASWEIALRPRAADCLAKAAERRGDPEQAATFSAQARVPRINMTPRAPGDLSLVRFPPNFREERAAELEFQMSHNVPRFPRPANITGNLSVRMIVLVGSDGRVLDFRFNNPPPTGIIAETIAAIVRGFKVAPAMPDAGLARFFRHASFICEPTRETCSFVLPPP